MRAPLAAIVLACLSLIVTDVAQAAIAPAGRIEVSRRVDPSLDRYMRTALVKTPLADMTADQQWMSVHARPLVVHDSDPTVSLNLTGWATKPKVSVYYNATGVNPYRPDQVAQASSFLLKQNGQQVMVDGWMAIDVTKPAARTWWLYGPDGKASCDEDPHRRGALDLLACGYTGLWLDNALTTPKQGFTPTPSINAKTWAKGMLTMLKTLKAKKPKGTTFTINMHWTDTDYGYAKKPKLSGAQAQIKAAKYADQVIIEGGAIDPGLHYALKAKFPWSYKRLLNFADAMHKQKVKLQWEKTGSSDLTLKASPLTGAVAPAQIPSCRDGDLAAPWVLGDASWNAHVRSAAVNYVSLLLTYAKGDGAGDMCEYPGRGWKGYEANLGNPAGKRYEKGNLVIRKFRGGIVAINPSDKTVKFRVPGGRKGVNLAATTWPQPTKAVKAVTLPTRTAAVIKYQ